MINQFQRFRFIVVLFISAVLLLSCGKLKELTGSKESKKENSESLSEKKHGDEFKKDEGELFFCDQYKDGEVINRSSKFTPGPITVMVDMRSTGKRLGTGKVELRISKIKDAAGNSVSERIIKTIPFDVQADWDYTYFTNKESLKFTEPGTYKVTCQKVDGTPIVSGVVEIVKD